MLLLNTFLALNGLLCADVRLRNYSLTHCGGLWSQVYYAAIGRHKTLLAI